MCHPHFKVVSKSGGHSGVADTPLFVNEPPWETSAGVDNNH